MTKKTFIVVSILIGPSCKPLEMKSEGLSSQNIEALHPLEKPFPNESKHIAKAIELAEKGVDNSKKSLGKAGRDAHTKAHGCVQATFTVKDDIPKEYKKGLFAEPKTFPAWIRFSAAAGEKKPDGDSGALGMAIKLMNVPGKKLLENEINETTHDFHVVNNPVFVVPDIGEYVAIQKWPRLYAASHWSTAKIFKTIKDQKSTDPAETRYWSMAAFAMGQSAVKYSAIPCNSSRTPYPEKPGEDFRAELLEKHLNSREACFKFAVQPYVNETLTPVENPMVEWKESDSPFTDVATIHIPIQKFRTPQRQEFCENLSFTPWHALPEHRPLGNLNRARKKVYEATSIKRHLDNNTQRVEPTPN